MQMKRILGQKGFCYNFVLLPHFCVSVTLRKEKSLVAEVGVSSLKRPSSFCFFLPAFWSKKINETAPWQIELTKYNGWFFSSLFPLSSTPVCDVWSILSLILCLYPLVSSCFIKEGQNRITIGCGWLSSTLLHEVYTFSRRWTLNP